MKKNIIKGKLSKDEIVIGTWIRNLRSDYLIQLIAKSSFDFVYIDMEHSSMTIDIVASLCLTAQLSGLVPIVRPADKLPHLLAQPLDCGAMGLLIPNVETAEEAKKVIQYSKYKPLGRRGVYLQGVHSSFIPMEGKYFTNFMNRETIIMVQIESKKGLKNIHDILSVKGVDGAVIGRNDLSLDLNLPGQVHHETVINAVKKLIKTCKKINKYPGLLVNDIDEAKYWIKMGIKIIVYSNTSNLLLKIYQKIIKELKNNPF